MWEQLEKALERRATAKGPAGAADDCSSGPASSGLQCARGGPGQPAVEQVANLGHGVPVVPGDGGEAPGGVVDLALDLYVAKERRNYEALPETPVRPPTRRAGPQVPRPGGQFDATPRPPALNLASWSLSPGGVQVVTVVIKAGSSLVLVVDYPDGVQKVLGPRLGGPNGDAVFFFPGTHQAISIGASTST